MYGIKVFFKICNVFGVDKVGNLVDVFIYFVFKLKYGRYLKRMF